MVKKVVILTLLIILWFWVIITWIHIIHQSFIFSGYVYQPYKKQLSVQRKSFLYLLYPFCCKPISGFYVKLVPFKEACKRLLITTLLCILLSWAIIYKFIKREGWRSG
jgi:uncharacterized membrane protein